MESYGPAITRTTTGYLNNERNLSCFGDLRRYISDGIREERAAGRPRAEMITNQSQIVRFAYDFERWYSIHPSILCTILKESFENPKEEPEPQTLDPKL